MLVYNMLVSLAENHLASYFFECTLNLLNHNNAGIFCIVLNHPLQGLLKPL